MSKLQKGYIDTTGLRGILVSAEVHMQVLQVHRQVKTRKGQPQMTAQTYINYEIVLMQQQFTPTGRIVTQTPNWTRRTFSSDPVARVFISSDGTFKAYNRDELVLCHGRTAEELEGCFD